MIDLVKLFMYTDLGLEQLDDLQAAVEGKLRVMGASRKLSMAHLIGPDLRATDAGKELFWRAEAIRIGEIEIVEREISKFDLSRCKRFIRQHYDYDWFGMIHAKCLVGLYQFPKQTWKRVCSVYGYDAVHDLCEIGWVIGGEQIGCALDLSGYCLSLVEELIIAYSH